jgi:hypothetical protein
MTANFTYCVNEYTALQAMYDAIAHCLCGLSNAMLTEDRAPLIAAFHLSSTPLYLASKHRIALTSPHKEPRKAPKRRLSDESSAEPNALSVNRRLRSVNSKDITALRPYAAENTFNAAKDAALRH